MRSLIRALWEHRREWRGKAIGAAIGLSAGWFGLVVGLIVGYLTDELLAQNRADRALIDYLETPGPSAFREPAPGVAAFCALAAFVAAPASGRRFLGPAPIAEGTGLPERIAVRAASLFGLGAKAIPALESYARVAALRVSSLNPDLLAESLAARRRANGDGAALVFALSEFAVGESGTVLLARIRATIGEDLSSFGAVAARAGDDPWAVLGLEPGAGMEQVKAAFRRLAVDVHPDLTGPVDEDAKRAAEEAFMRLEAAYQAILRQKADA